MNEIKTVQSTNVHESPYRLYEGHERLEEIPASEAERRYLLRQLHIDILTVINKYMWLSAKHIRVLLPQYPKTAIRNALKVLQRRCYVRAVLFVDREGLNGPARAFCIGRRAQRELLQCGIIPNRYVELQTHTCRKVKSVLAANQTFLPMRDRFEKFDVRVPVVGSPQDATRRQIFKTSILAESDEEVLLIAAVRSHNENQVCEKLRRMHRVLSMENTLPANKRVRVLLVFDSELHLVQMKPVIAPLLEAFPVEVELTHDRVTATRLPAEPTEQQAV